MGGGRMNFAEESGCRCWCIHILLQTPADALGKEKDTTTTSLLSSRDKSTHHMNSTEQRRERKRVIRMSVCDELKGGREKDTCPSTLFPSILIILNVFVVVAVVVFYCSSQKTLVSICPC